MFRRSTSPPPPSSPASASSISASATSPVTSSTNNDSNKPLNDWKRRFQQKAKLKLGLTSDVKDNVTGNLELRIERYRTCSTKVLGMKNECDQFCSKIRIFLSIEQSMMSFLPETNISRIYDEIHQQHLSSVVEVMLVHEIETPIHFLFHKSEEIEQLLKLRTDQLLMDYQHHLGKLESLQEKSPNKIDEIKIRQTKVEAAAERLKEGNHFLEAHLKAYEFAYVRLKKRLGNVIYAINLFISQTLASSLSSSCELTPEINTIMEQIQSIRISHEERRVVSFNAAHDAAQITHSSSALPSGGNVSHHNQHQHHQSHHPPHQYQRQPSSSSSSIMSNISRSLRPSESHWNDVSSSSHHSIFHSSADRPASPDAPTGEDSSQSHGPGHSHRHSQADDDFNYSLNLHLGILGEIFGRSLSEQKTVPDIVLDCLLFLYHNSLSIEGIFRISGDEDLVADLRRSYDEGKGSHTHYRTLSSSSVTESHNLASLIKLYLRLLPEPLFPKRCYRLLSEALQLSDVEYINRMKLFFEPHTPFSGTDSDSLLSCDEKLNIVNMKIFSYLLFVLNEITKRTEQNKMTGDNLAIIFAPSLLCPEGAHELGLYELQTGIGILKRLLVHSEEICEELWRQFPLEEA